MKNYKLLFLLLCLVLLSSCAGNQAFVKNVTVKKENSFIQMAQPQQSLDQWLGKEIA